MRYRLLIGHRPVDTTQRTPRPQTIGTLLLAAVLTLLIPLPPVNAQSQAQISAEPVRIVAIFSQTGIAATHNEPLIPMVQLAVEEINRAGGVLGRPIQLILLDNQSTPIGARLAAEKAIRLKATAVVGAHWSSHSLAMAPVLQAASIPMISPGSTNPDVTRIGNFIFRACFVDSFQGVAMATFATQDLKARTAVVVQNIDEAYSVMLAEFFKKAFIDSGGRVLLEEGYRGKAIDFSRIIKKIQREPPDVVYLPGYTRDSGLFIKQAIQLKLKSTFLGGDAWDEIEQIAGDAINGSFQSAPWHPQAPFPRSIYLQNLFRRKFMRDIDNVSAPLAFDAVMLLVDAMKRADSLQGEDIRLALSQTVNYQGATGIFSFDDYGDPRNKDVIIIQFRKGRRLFHKTIRP
ncbi:MAG: ABC transporter substrate-binding protein [Desulfosarcinaceae bacterium]|nr:ABC transporter substrate-binding protein [Desulfosarcinaceae bacterium]